MKSTEIFLSRNDPKGDSTEVMLAYYAGQLMQLEHELNQLTILEHPCQIQGICKEMSVYKQKLAQANPQKNSKLI